LNLKTLCKEKGFTLTKLSEQTKITIDYLSKLSTGKRNNPSSEIIQKISNVLGTTSDEVINSIRN
jgi:transcriptional regulator with XRE-family HTH domain